MLIIMADIAQRRQIGFGVFSAFDVSFDMVQFEVSGVGRVPLFVSPAALSATVMVTNQNGTSNGVGNFAVVSRALPILLKHIHADGKVRPSC